MLQDAGLGNGSFLQEQGRLRERTNLLKGPPGARVLLAFCYFQWYTGAGSYALMRAKCYNFMSFVSHVASLK